MEKVPDAIQRRTQTSPGEGEGSRGAPRGVATLGSRALRPAVLRGGRGGRGGRVCSANGRPERGSLARSVPGVWSPARLASEAGAGDTRQRGGTLKSHCARGQEPDAEAQKHLEQADPRRRKAEQRLPGAFFCLFFHTGGRVSVWDDEHVWGQMAVMVTRHRTCTSCHGAADFKMVKLVHVTLCLFYCNTRIFSLKTDSRTGALCSNRDESQNRKKNVA